MRKLLTAVTFIAIMTTPALSSSDSSGHGAVAAGVHVIGEVHSINGEMVNVTHEPIPDIGWPAMTMDLRLLEGAETGNVSAGDTVRIVLEKDDNGMYGIRALELVE